jgi:hypothetical protein
MSVRYISRQEKIELARDAMQATIDVRFQLGVGLEEPICTYSACERLGVPVRFVDISMEGMNFIVSFSAACPAAFQLRT